MFENNKVMSKLYINFEKKILLSNQQVALHYENLPMQYKQIFLALKIENFQLKIFDVFLIFAQNIDCGYTLEPPRRVPTIYVLEQK